MSTYFIYMVIYTIIIWIKVDFSKKLFDFPPQLFLSKVLVPSVAVTILSFILPFGLASIMHENVARLFVMVPLSIVSTTLCIYLFGLTKGEKKYITYKIQSKLGFARA